MEYRQIEKQAALLKAISHPVRLDIVLILKGMNGLDSGSLQHVAEVSWPDLSRHLKVLEAAGIVKSQKDGRHRVYWLQPGLAASLGQLTRHLTL